MIKKVIDCLGNIGVFIGEEQVDKVLLSDLIQDSLTFITMIVELENTFKIEIPDSYLSYEAMQTLEDVVAIVNILQKGGENNEKGA